MKFGIKKFSLKKEKPSDLILEKVLLKEETLVISDDIKENKLLEYDELQRQYVDNPTLELGQAIAKLFNEIYNPRPESNHQESSQGLVEETDGTQDMIDVSGNKGSHVMDVKQDQDNTIIQDTTRAGFVEEPDDGTYIDPNVDQPAKVPDDVHVMGANPEPEPTQEAEASVELDNDNDIGTVSEPLDPNIEDMLPPAKEQTTPKFNVKVEGNRIIEKLEPKVKPEPVPAETESRPTEAEAVEDNEVESSTTDLTEPVKIPEVDLSEPIKIPDEIPANADLTPDELEKLAQVKNEAIKKEQEVLREIGAERRRKEQEAELIRQEADKEKQYVDYLWKLVDDDLKEQKQNIIDEQKQNIIDEQLAKQPEKKLERKSWSTKTKEAEEVVLSIAGDWLSVEEDESFKHEQSLEDHTELKEMFNEEEEHPSISEYTIDESIAQLEESITKLHAKKEAEKVANETHDVMVEDSDPDFDLKEKENKENAKQLADETIIDIKEKKSFWKREKKPEVIPEIETPIVPINDLTMPADLSPELKKVWEFLPNDNKLEIIQKHKDENVEIIQENKKKLFGNKINFSLKRKQMIQPELVDNPKLFAKLKSKIIKVKANDLHGIEAYCNICKHEIKSHQLKGKSSGCGECGCLTTVQSILDVNHIKLKLDYSEIDHRDSGKTCNCGHREIVHRDKGFCEEQDCYCIGFKDQPEN